jgi:hypothetical protein
MNAFKLGPAVLCFAVFAIGACLPESESQDDEETESLANELSPATDLVLVEGVCEPLSALSSSVQSRVRQARKNTTLTAAQRASRGITTIRLSDLSSDDYAHHLELASDPCGMAGGEWTCNSWVSPDDNLLVVSCTNGFITCGFGHGISYCYP